MVPGTDEREVGLDREPRDHGTALARYKEDSLPGFSPLGAQYLSGVVQKEHRLLLEAEPETQLYL